MAFNCWECGATGHVGAECPNIEQIGDGRPMWCGTCDERSRHWYDDQGRAHRCQCHPLSHLPLKQNRRCPSCKATVYIWDLAPCDQHQPVGRQLEHIDLAPRIPAAPKDYQLIAAMQVAESRASRPVI